MKDFKILMSFVATITLTQLLQAASFNCDFVTNNMGSFKQRIQVEEGAVYSFLAPSLGIINFEYQPRYLMITQLQADRTKLSKIEKVPDDLFVVVDTETRQVANFNLANVDVDLSEDLKASADLMSDYFKLVKSGELLEVVEVEPGERIKDTATITCQQEIEPTAK